MKRPRQLEASDLLDDDSWVCWFCGEWGFLGDPRGHVCEGCGNVMCEQCASVHDCQWA